MATTAEIGNGTANLKQELLDDIRRAVSRYVGETVNTLPPNQTSVKLHESTIGTDEILAVIQCLMENKITMGAEVKGFEEQLEQFFEVANAVTVNSGSSANLLAVSALTNTDLDRHLRFGDEVIVPALSWSTSVWPIIQMGLTPVIVDVNPKTLNIDVEQARKAVSKKTKAVMPIHVYGNPCNMDELIDLCEQANLILIEDCCEALGAKYNNQHVGTFGSVGTYSTYFSHHITTLEGGFTITNNEDLAETMRIRRAHGWVRDTRHPEKWTSTHSDIDPRFLFVDQGYNFRISEPQGAMGKVQLSKLTKYIEQRRAAVAQLTEKLAKFENYVRVQKETTNGYHSWFGMPMTIAENAPFTTRAIRQFLESRKIETRPVICGNIARQPAIQRYAHRVFGSLPHATNVMQNGFAIGSHQDVGSDHVEYIADAFSEFLGSC